MCASFSLPIVATFSRAIATIAFMSGASTSARAQTYDPSYPVCMHIYGRISYFDCRYASLEQCRFLAASRSTSCVVNPYFAQTKQAAPRRSRRVD
ncbi:DUF3551 domain-containing protein [Bradyrhizobium monzae]|uniref:DUF3551 domain-containing protein n=1 Tax=Bradyrhizobium sp. Oc8 TaxID=2876780 RepID=UPI0023EECB72|nr:DUF3551 domain-containing protein [Bradyrhizobium sp. Oc8]